MNLITAYFCAGTFALGLLIGSSIESDAYSGVETDTETGCQYMATRNGGITPRIDADGIHMGCKGLQEVGHAAP